MTPEEQAQEIPEETARGILGTILSDEQEVIAIQARIAVSRRDLAIALARLPKKTVSLEDAATAELRETKRLRRDDAKLRLEMSPKEWDVATVVREPSLTADGIRAVMRDRAARGDPPLVHAAETVEDELVIRSGGPKPKRATPRREIPDSAVLRIEGEQAWEVASSLGHGTYRVTLDGELATGTWECTCPDSQQRSGPNCKHCRAVRRKEGFDGA